MLLLFSLGTFFQFLYNKSPENPIELKKIQETLNSKTNIAEKKMNDIADKLLRGNLDSIYRVSFEKLSSIYLVYKNERLIFWSSNQAEPQLIHSPQWHYKKISNIHAVVKSKTVGEYEVVAYVPIKYNFPYENMELKNTFFKGFNINKDVSIVPNLPTNRYALFNNTGDYLFTLQLPDYKIYKESLSIISLIFFLVAFLLSFYIYARFPLFLGRTNITYREFWLISGCMGFLVFVLLIFDIPKTFFLNKTFTPFLYATNTILTTLTHLSFLTLFLFCTVFLFCFYVKKELDKEKNYLVYKYLILTINAVYFFLIFIFLKDVVFNSVTELNILKLNAISISTIWNHILFLIWGISFMMLHINTHRILLKRENLKRILIDDAIVGVLISILAFSYIGKYGIIGIIAYPILSFVLYLPHYFTIFRKNQWYLAIWLFPFTIFVTWSSVFMNAEKRYEKYKIIAENHFLNEHTEEDRIAESLIKELNTRIKYDAYIKEMVRHQDSIKLITNYINNSYLRGFWNKYEVHLFTAPINTKLDFEYRDVILTWGKRVGTTNFHSITNPNSDMKFLGEFTSTKDGEESINYYIEFYPKTNYKSFSYPNLLIETPPSIQSKLSLSSARYEYRELVYSSGDYKYTAKANWIKRNNLDYFVQKENGYKHYIYVPNIYNYYVLSEEDNSGFFPYLMYLFYTFAIYISTVFFFIWVTKKIKRENNSSFTSKFMSSFTFLLVTSLVAIFYVSTNYIQNNYQKQQQKVLIQTKNYIQSVLQDKYFWTEHLDSTMTANIAADLEDLSYTYQTDIHVYDNKGKLIATSQPSLFSRGISSTQISPIAYFSKNESMNRYETIGDLEFLTAYTDFYNGDFLQIGYIAIPQYLSNNLLKKELQSFLVVIVHIYLLIIFIFIVLSLIISKQLSSPLKMLGENLNQIRLGKENKKIKYSQNDEIKLLVERYNDMVDELEKSAKLLAESERESAWKIMARQVAHEIKNPLTPMKLTIQQIQRRKKMNDENFDEYLDAASNTLIEQIENLARIATAFSSVAKLPDVKLSRVDIAKKINSVANLFANNEKNIIVEYNGDTEGYFVFADREKIIQAFNNLLKNAIQAIPTNRKGLIKIELKTIDNQIYITIKDNGRGMNAETKEKLFTPNFTTKSTGMGLGLYITKNIIETFGGKIFFESELNIGTKFTVIMPLVK